MKHRTSGKWGPLAGLVLAAGAWSTVVATAAAQQATAPAPPSAVEPAPASAVEPAPAVETPSPAPVPTAGPRPPRRWPGEVVILQGIADAAEFWKKLDAPDWIVTRPSSPRVNDGAGASVVRANVEAVHVGGTVEGDGVRVVLDVHCEVFGEGEVWVPLKLDVPVVLSAREGSRELELRRQGEGGLWEARLEGVGTRRLRVEAAAPIRVGAQRRTLDLAIPEAPATSFDLMLPRRAFDVEVGAGEAVRPEPVEGRGQRVAAHVRPRSRLVVSWSEQEAGAPLLSAQVEMEIEVDAEGVSVRSSWAVSCSRGVARSLQIRLGDDEVVSRVLLNDQFQASGIERSGKVNLLTIPLPEPLRAGESRRLVLESRRPSSGTFEFEGYPLTDAGEQSGFLGVTQGPNLFVSALKLQGLRRIDPRDLPTALKARPGTTIAMQFSEQPFAMSLGVEPAPPLFRADASARLFVDPDGVRNETTLDVERVRGSLYEIEVAVPPELKVASVGPADLVEATAAPRPDGGDAASRILRIRLTPQARDRSAFSLKLEGRQAAVAPGDVRLGLFSPRGAVGTMSSFTVVAGRDVSLEPLDESLVKESAAEATTTRAEGDAPPALRLRTARNPVTLDLRLERRTMDVRRDTTLAARFSRRAVEVRQETRLRVRNGTATTATVQVPEGVAPRWDVSDGRSAVRTEELDGPSPGVRRARLTFDRPVVEATLTFHYRLPLGRPLTSEGPTPVLIPWITFESGTPGSCTVAITSDPDVEVAVDDPAWAREEPAAGEPRGPRRFRLERDDSAGGLATTARLVESVAMPAVVASRAFVRSALDADGGLRVRAWYAVESHGASLSVAPPAGASWLRVRVDGRAVERVDAVGDGSASRIELPPESADRPVLLDLEYRVPAASAGRPWRAPELLDGAEVLQTYWLVQVPWALVSPLPPAGWTDEGRWAWDGPSLSRRPVASEARLAAWAAGPSAPAAALEGAPEEDLAARGLLFSRSGPPTPMNPILISRAWAVLFCSGLALAASLALTYFPARAPWALAAAVAAGLPAAMFLPAAAWAFGLQSAAFGLSLGLIAAAVRRWATREAAAPATTSSRGPLGSSVIVSESSQRLSGVGSDDSTAIRVRNTTTMDYLAAPPPPGPDPDAPLASRRPSGLSME